jgi:MEMO1 family protein
LAVTRGIPAALISPHAGYIYSGPVAIYGYRALKGFHPRTVIILAPSHHEYIDGAAVIRQGSFETPLGKVPIDTKMVEKLISLTSLVKEKRTPFEKEHALEVQLPFLQCTLEKFTLVPLIVGKMNQEECKKLGNTLASLDVPGETLIVASSDMSHYHPYKEAQSIDRRTIHLVKTMDMEGLARALAKEECELCGGTPVLVTMYAMKALSCKPEVLKYANSGDTAGPKDKVVGYTSVIFWKDKKEKEAHSMKDEEFLNGEEKKTLLTMARKTLEEYLKTGKAPEFFKDTPVPENLKKEAGMFVTLRKNHDLRGCIGYIVGREPLYHAVSELAISSATRDPRFPPVKFEELKHIHIEISVMSPLRKVQSADEIVLGTHGVYVKKGFYSGIFLPQVATETGWDKETFLRQLCAGKAGLPQDAWKDKDTELQVFTADIFEEE